MKHLSSIRSMFLCGVATDMGSSVDVARRNTAIGFLRERPADAKPFF